MLAVISNTGIASVFIFEVESTQRTEEALQNDQNPAAEMGRYVGLPLA